MARMPWVVGLLAVATYFALWERKRAFRREVVFALFPGVTLIAGFWCWYQFWHGPTDVFQMSMQQTRAFVADPPWSHLPEIGMTYAVYLGSFVAALAIALPLSEWRNLGRRATMLGLVCVWLLVNAVVFAFLDRNLLFPYMRNVISPWGVFSPNTFLLGSRELLFGQPVAWCMTALSVVGCVALIQRLSRGSSWPVGRSPIVSARWSVSVRLGSLWLLWQLAYIAGTTPVLFDRHLLILAPSSILLFVLRTPPNTSWNLVRFAIVAVPMG